MDDPTRPIQQGAEPTPALGASRAEVPHTEKKRIVFIDIGRAVGAILVFYSHIAEQWLRRRGERNPVVSVIESLTSEPMHMSKQGIGQIAVPMFFLISGYVVTSIALRQGQLRFSLNRLLRVYPPMIFVVLLTALVVSLGVQPLNTGQLNTISPLTLLTNSLLVNYLIFPQVVLVGVAWTLVIEVIFYLLLVMLLPLLRRQMWLALAVELVFVVVVLMTRSQFGNSYSLFAVNVSYLPIPMLGQIIWAWYAKKIPSWLGGIYVAAGWSLYVLGDIINVGRIDTSYNLALAVAVLFFVVGLFAEPKLRERRFWTVMAERSYSLYLLHGLVAFAVLGALEHVMPFWLSVWIAVGATLVAVEVSYRFVEQPSHRLARKLARRRQSSTEEPAVIPETPPDALSDAAVEVTVELHNLAADRNRSQRSYPALRPEAPAALQQPTAPPGTTRVPRGAPPPHSSSTPQRSAPSRPNRIPPQESIAHALNPVIDEPRHYGGQPPAGPPQPQRHPPQSRQRGPEPDGAPRRRGADGGPTVAELMANQQLAPPHRGQRPAPSNDRPQARDARDLNGSRPSDVNGSRPSDANGSRPSDSNRARPSDLNGSRPSDTNRTRPSDANGSRPSDTNRTRFNDANGSRPSDTNRTRPSDVNGSRPRDVTSPRPNGVPGQAPPPASRPGVWTVPE